MELLSDVLAEPDMKTREDASQVLKHNQIMKNTKDFSIYTHADRIMLKIHKVN